MCVCVCVRAHDFLSQQPVSRHDTTKLSWLGDDDVASNRLAGRWMSGAENTPSPAHGASHSASDHSSRRAAATPWPSRSTGDDGSGPCWLLCSSRSAVSLGHNGLLHLGHSASSDAIFSARNDGLPWVRLTTRMHLVESVTTLALMLTPVKELPINRRKVEDSA